GWFFWGFIAPLIVIGIFILLEANNPGLNAGWFIATVLFSIIFSFLTPWFAIRWCYQKAYAESAPRTYGCGPCLICFIGGGALSCAVMNPIPFLITFAWFCYVAVHPKKVE
ncbi:MAG: hypothetical protein Q4C70_15595, partial [Planctomycetia bacterium]|nr:hypothetical protein [Planctomycetia bacterium]